MLYALISYSFSPMCVGTKTMTSSDSSPIDDKCLPKQGILADGGIIPASEMAVGAAGEEVAVIGIESDDFLV